jgi:hypothetical protein
MELFGVYAYLLSHHRFEVFTCLSCISHEKCSLAFARILAGFKHLKKVIKQSGHGTEVSGRP